MPGDGEVPQVQEFACTPQRTALVVVDLENDFCDPRGRAYAGKAAEEAVRAAAAAAETVRSGGGKVIWVRSVRDRDAMEFTVYKQKLRLLRGTWGTEFALPLQVREGEPVIEKNTHDCFYRTEMDACLERSGIVAPDWSILVAGVSMNVCVHHAVLGFSIRDYRVGIPMDCVAPWDERARPTLWHYSLRGYAYNVTVTRSDLIRWGAPSVADRS